MASKGQKVLSSAAAGAGIGSMFGGPLGAGIGAGVGSIFGLFTGSDANYTPPNYSDAEAEMKKTDLFKRLQEQQQLVDQARTLYNQRRTSLTPEEQNQLAIGQAHVAQQLQGQGLSGTSDAALIAARARSEQEGSMQDRIFNEQNALYGQMAGQQNAYTQNYGQAVNSVMNPLMAQYQANMGAKAANDQMWSGVFGGGAQMLGSGINAYNQNQMAERLLAAKGGTVNLGLASPAPAYQPSYGFGAGGGGGANGYSLGVPMNFGPSSSYPGAGQYSLGGQRLFPQYAGGY